jgi:aminoglycoside phosphotransferase
MSDNNLSAFLNPVQPARKRAQEVKDSVYVKHGTGDQIRRAVEAIDFVRQHTSVPVPSVLQIHVDENDTNPSSWFSMNAMPGSPLMDAWPNMNEEARTATQNDLRTYLHELRAIPPPAPAFIGSCNGGPAYDHRLNNGHPCGPFISESDFKDFLVAPVARCPRKELVYHYRQQLVDNHRVVFTHADLCGEHIFVEPTTGRITGLIDWEMAGWWPAYWEYTRSRFGNRYEMWWKKLVANVLDPYQHELRIEEDLQQF